MVRKVIVHKTTLDELDDSFDREFWAQIPPEERFAELVEAFNGEHYGITFTLDEYYKTDADTSFGGDVLYRHAWNDAGRFRLQVSLRERQRAAAPQPARPPRTLQLKRSRQRLQTSAERKPPIDKTSCSSAASITFWSTRAALA